MEYNDIELRQLKAVHVKIPSIPNFMDISMVDQAICDIGLTLLADEIADSEEVEIKKEMVFDTLEYLKYFLMDYVVRFHRLYYVTHFEKNKRYMVLCKNGCQWGLWARRQRNEKWKIRNVRQPHTLVDLRSRRVCTPKTQLVTLVIILLAQLGPIVTHLFQA
jgi:hypothetical protein